MQWTSTSKGIGDCCLAGGRSARCSLVSPQAAAGPSMPGEAVCVAPSEAPPWVLGADRALLPATSQGRWGWWPLGCLHKQVTRWGGHQQPLVTCRRYLWPAGNKGTCAGCACRATHLLSASEGCLVYGVVKGSQSFHPGASGQKV